MNQVSLIGRLTKDPDARYTESGKAVTRFTLAVGRGTKDGEADFIPVVCFDKTAENVSRYLAKGRQAGVTGKLRTGSYTNRDGKTVYTTDVLADRVEFIGSSEPQGRPILSDPEEDHFEQIQEDIPF